MVFLPWKTSKKRLREAERARQNRIEVVKAHSQGQVSRRDLIKMGVLTAGGALVLKNGLSPFAPSAYAEVPTGTPPSPIPRGIAFTQAMPRLQVLDRYPVVRRPRDPLLDPLINADETDDVGQCDHMQGPAAACHATQSKTAVQGSVQGPREGRPPGDLWSHQRWSEFFPKVAMDVSVEPLHAGFRFHPALPEIRADKVWTWNGTLPPPLVLARYGEPILYRNHNRLPNSNAENGGFGRNTITTHWHNGHTPAESDGFANAFFYPGQYYDYRWPITLAGHDSINTDASDPRAGAPDDNGGITNVRGDWREIESTMWFHDHMLDFTAQNVYKGNAAMFNLYSSRDRGDESINDGVNLQLPSGSSNGKGWANLDYDVNLMVAEKALDPSGQMYFDIFQLDGFVGDMMTVNFAYNPYLEVEPRKYRFRILNASVSRFFKTALADASGRAVPFYWIGNDGNLLTQPLLVKETDEQGIAERYDIVVDFSTFKGQKLWLVNLCEHQDGKMPSADRTLGDALGGKSNDPCVGKFLELRVVKPLAGPDLSKVPAKLTELPARNPVVRERRFEFGRSGGAEDKPWTIKVDNGSAKPADMTNISAAPKPGTAELWTLVNGGGGWDHPVHIHFEEGQTLSRNGKPPPDWERLGRKDVYRLRPSGTVQLYMQFREFAGTFMEHCHNTQHEDHAMLLRWDINGGATALPTPIPSPSGCSFIDSKVG
ncbi:MAG: multicopper oxidase family protein [Anaeromyxobacteraceae bacterium]